MGLDHTRLIGLALSIVTSVALTVRGQETCLLDERVKFSPGTTFEMEALPGASAMEKRDGGVVLDKDHHTMSVALPIHTEAKTTYALMCRSKAIRDATFNWIDVESGGKTAGHVFPCTTTYTNKKALLQGNGADKLNITLVLKEGPGCGIDSLRLYEASQAYAIKTLCPADSLSGGELPSFSSTDAFRDYAIQSALWLEVRGKKGLRVLVKRTGELGTTPEVFRLMIGRYIEYLETPDLPRQNVGDTSFEMHHPIKRWDEIESNPAFSNAWRLEIVNTFYLMARTSFIDWAAYSLPRYYRDYQQRHNAEWRSLGIPAEPYAYTRENMVPAKLDAAQEFNKRHAFLPHNHMTHPARALLFAARYFERYGISEAPIWYRCARWTFEPLMRASKPAEDCSTYQYWAMIIAADFASLEGRGEFFARGGPLWKFMDLVVMSANNIGDGPAYGDHGYYPQNVVVPGPMEADAFDAIVKTKAFSTTDEFRKMLSDKRREDYLGVHVHPLERLFYEFWMDQRGGIPLREEERFDKISFRRSFDPNDQYLLLDGISFGYHGHQDGNSILQFDDENRTWLVERGYPLQEGKHKLQGNTGRAGQHNGVTVSRPDVNKGEESPLDKTPTFSALVFRREDEKSAATSTASRDLNGMDWTRHIMWAKERYFVVIDELTAREGGPVTLRCRWRTLGAPRLDGQRLVVVQKPKPGVDVKDRRELGFVLIHCDEAAASLTKGIEPPKTWEAYPYAEPEVQVLLEQFEADLKAGERRVFVNVFAVLPTGEEDKLTAKREGDGAVEVTYRGCRERVDLTEKTISPIP